MVLTLKIGELIFNNFHCGTRDASLEPKDIYEVIAVEVGDDAHKRAHQTAVEYLETHYKGRWDYLATELNDGNIKDLYQYGWKDNRTGLRPAMVKRFDVEKVRIV